MSVPGSVFSMFALLIFLPSGETTYTTTAASAVLFLIKVFRVYIKNRENVKYILNRRVNTVYCKAPEKLAQHIRRNCRIVSPADKKINDGIIRLVNDLFRDRCVPRFRKHNRQFLAQTAPVLKSSGTVPPFFYQKAKNFPVLLI